MLSVVMLSVVMLTVFMLSDLAPSSSIVQTKIIRLNKASDYIEHQSLA
jgi:hypothetical protein